MCPPEDVPEHAILAGREAVLRYVSDYIDAFDDFDIAATELIDRRDSVRLSRRIKGSATRVELTGAQLWTFNRGQRVSRIREFRSLADALEAAGLSE